MKRPQPGNSFSPADCGGPTPAVLRPSTHPWRHLRLHLLVSAIRRQDLALAQHGRRVQQIALFLGASLQLPQRDLDLLSPAALFHDLGKTFVLPSLLAKREPLTRREWQVLKEHPTIGADLCDALPALHAIRPLIQDHHEHLDGSGYPNRRSGSDLSLATQLIQVADVIDAITSTRPYKPAYPLTHALALLTSEAERGWRDPSLVRQCARLLRDAEERLLRPPRPSPPPPDPIADLVGASI